MALIKRKQIDLYIKSAAGSVPDGVFGIDNLAGIASGTYSITAGDQYEIVVDKIVGAIDDIADQIDGLYFTYLVNGAGNKNLTKQATIDLKSTANQVSVAKNDLTNGVEYTFSLPSAVIAPGSMKVTTTTELVGNVTLSGNAQTITHTGTGDLTISSTNGEVYIENSRFNGNNATIPGDLTVSGSLSVIGNITQTQVNDVVVKDRFIKLANGNDGSVTITGLYQQTGASEYAGLIYDANKNKFRLFTTPVEPTTDTNTSALVPADLILYRLDADTVDFLAMGDDAKETVQDLIAGTLEEGFGINLAYNDAGPEGSGTLTISVDINQLALTQTLTVKTYEDSSTPTEYTINLLSESLVFTESDTALVKKIDAVEALKVILRGTIHEDIVHNVNGGAGKFTLDGNGNAVITLTYAVSPGEFKDIKENKEYVQVFINGVKCKYYECQWTYSSQTVTVYAGSNTSGNYTGVGFQLEASDIFTVLYYGDKENVTADPAVTTTTTAAPVTTTTTSPITTQAPVYTAYQLPMLESNIVAVDIYDDTIVVGTENGQVWLYGGTDWTAVAVIPGDTAINSINLKAGLWIASSNTGLAWSNGNLEAGWNVIITLPSVEDQATSSVYYAPNSFLIGTENGKIHRTTTNGASWTQVYNFEINRPVADMAIETISGAHLIAVCGNKVAYTNNYGETWQLVHTLTGVAEPDYLTSASITKNTTDSDKITAIVSNSTRIDLCRNIVENISVWSQNEVAGTYLPIKASAINSNGLIVIVDGSTTAYKKTAEALFSSASIQVEVDAILDHAGDSIGSFDSNIVIGGQTVVSKKNS